MKKILIVLLAALLVLAAVACKAKEEPQEAAENEIVDGPLAGGWTPAEDFSITDERQAIFDKGMAVISSIHTPLAYLGSQVVAGTNHCFLSKGSNWLELVYFYEDLQGNVQLMNIADLPIVPQADGTVTAPEEGLMGGWSYAEDPAVTEEILTRFSQTLAGKTGVSYAPVANLGTQVVAGLNRCLLCEVSAPQPHYALVYVYETLDGGAEIFKVIDLDVGAFCTYGA